MKRSTIVLLSAILAVLVVIAVVLVMLLTRTPEQPTGCDRFPSGSADYYGCIGTEEMQGE